MHFLAALLFLFVSSLNSPCSARTLAASSDAPDNSTSWSSPATTDQASTTLAVLNTTIQPTSQRWPPSSGGNQTKKGAGGYFESCIDCRLFSKYEGGKPKEGGGGLLRCDCDYPGRPGGFRRRESVVNLNDWLGNVQGKLTASFDFFCDSFATPHPCFCKPPANFFFFILFSASSGRRQVYPVAALSARANASCSRAATSPAGAMMRLRGPRSWT